jgi:NhaA family Na+:H+ antiporter
MSAKTSPGILLVAAAIVALAWANSPWASSYAEVWETPFGLRIGGFALERSLAWVVNDVLMAVFFFVVGLEIRSEIHHGELSDWRKAALPVAAALGGMVIPAVLYLLIAHAPATRSGWGIPTATDIAFAVGILSLLGKRVPPALRVLLLTLAIIDDLGAIVVIAFFYAEGVAPHGLAVAALSLVGVLAMRRLGVRAKVAYLPPAIGAWAGVYAAGIHPAIAGVFLGFVVPEPRGGGEALHRSVGFGIMPLFALANAGVSFSGTVSTDSSWRVAAAVTAGLVLGKPTGVLLAVFLSRRLNVARIPTALTARHLVVLGLVAGVGFTMSLFIADLAFADAALLAAAKIGVVYASAIATVLAVTLGRWLLPRGEVPTVPWSSSTARASTGCAPGRTLQSDD